LIANSSSLQVTIRKERKTYNLVIDVAFSYILDENEKSTKNKFQITPKLYIQTHGCEKTCTNYVEDSVCANTHTIPGQLLFS
jgi:hypothetical protein